MNRAEPKGQERNGRRIYVHELSFVSLGQRSEAAALLVFNSLGRTIVEKIAHHHLEQAIEVKLVDSIKGQGVVKRLGQHYNPVLTLTLQQIGYRPAEPAHHSDFYPLLGGNEHILASCSEAGYFTFATSIQAAKRMFAEKGSMHMERTAIREGKGPIDITWVNGRNLALLRPDLPIGPSMAPFYFGPTSRGELLSIGKFASLKQQVATQILTEVETVVLGDEDWNSAGEARMLGQLFATCQATLAKGIFADRRS
jgi:hypothetical protein